MVWVGLVTPFPLHFFQLINFVPHQQAYIVERFGRYLKTLEPVSPLHINTCNIHHYNYHCMCIGFKYSDSIN